MIDRNLLVFDLAQQQYALPVSQVQEVLPRAALTPLPEAPAALAGILRLRGALVPIVDLRRRLGLPPVAPEIGHCVVVALVGRTPVGLLVDSVRDLAFADEGIEAEPAVRAGRVVQRVIETSGRVVTVLDAAAAVGAEIGAFLAALDGVAGDRVAP